MVVTFVLNADFHFICIILWNKFIYILYYIFISALYIYPPTHHHYCNQCWLLNELVHPNHFQQQVRLTPMQAATVHVLFIKYWALPSHLHHQIWQAFYYVTLHAYAISFFESTTLQMVCCMVWLNYPISLASGTTNIYNNWYIYKIPTLDILYLCFYPKSHGWFWFYTS